MTRLRNLFVTPAAVLLLITIAVPAAIICVYSVLSRGAYGGVEPPWTLENYSRVIDPLYGGIFVRSFALAGAATTLCILLGFPLALFIAQSGARKNLYLSLVILPFWTSFLIRIAAWRLILADQGLLNSLLINLHLVHEPLRLLDTTLAVMIGLVYGELPFMILPLYASLEKLDRSLLEASADLGAPPAATFFRVTVPMTLPGIIAGIVLVFIPGIGQFIVSDMLGGARTMLIGNMIQDQFTSGRNKPLGAALAFELTAMVLALLVAYALYARGRTASEGLV